MTIGPKSPSVANPNCVESLWSRWTESFDDDIRNQIFEYYFPWCRKIASSLFTKYNDPSLDWQDYVNIVSIATLTCIEKYDVSLGVPFEGYAFPRVKGSVLNTIRSNIRHSESKSLDTLIGDQNLNEKDGSFETIINLTIELTLSNLLEFGAMESSEPSYHYEKEQTSQLLGRLVEKLPDQQKFVVKAYYFQQLSITNISELLGVSKARISQVHKLGIRALREIYEQLY